MCSSPRHRIQAPPKGRSRCKVTARPRGTPNATALSRCIASR
ncbi:MAG: hypothetical protein FJ284_11590 [Planctomycetes bacterium]|nr:hypothetical protein [Planctomycetota bacterium]